MLDSFQNKLEDIYYSMWQCVPNEIVQLLMPAENPQFLKRGLQKQRITGFLFFYKGFEEIGRKLLIEIVQVGRYYS